MQPGIVADDCERVAVTRDDRVDQQLPSLAVERPHAPDMRREMPVHDELGQHRLLQQLPFAIQLGEAVAKRIDQRSGTTM